MCQRHLGRQLCLMARIDCKKVNKYYVDTDEIPKGHMRKVRQGVRSTKERVSVPNDNDEKVPRRKQHDIYVRVDQVKDTIYITKRDVPS